jgi:hypothetical protein
VDISRTRATLTHIEFQRRTKINSLYYNRCKPLPVRVAQNILLPGPCCDRIFFGVLFRMEKKFVSMCECAGYFDLV